MGNEEGQSGELRNRGRGHRMWLSACHMRVRGGGSPLSTVAAEDKEKEGRGTNSNPVGWVNS